MLGLKVGAIGRRVETLESRVLSLECRRAEASRDDLVGEAVRVAEKLKIGGAVFWEPARREDRQRLARELESREWTWRQIAGVLGCTEKTVQRLLK